MSDHGSNTTPGASPKVGGPKTPTKKNMAQIELTPIESLLFFNMIRFGNLQNINWDQVASHSNLKNAASARVRFRQILKKHGLMELAPKTPQSQAQKRKAASKSKERPDDDDDGGSSYHPSPVAVKASARKRSTRAGGGRAKMQKVDVQSKDDQDDDDQEDDDQDDEEAVADGVVAAAASAPSAELDTEPNVETKTDAKTEIKAEADSGSDTGMAPLNDDGVTGGIDGTNSASPHEYGRDQATQGFSGGMDHLMAPFHRQSALPANLGEIQMMQLQLRRPSMGSFASGQQLNPYQLAALQAPRDPWLQPHQMTSELQRHQLRMEAQAQLFDRFESLQMLPYVDASGDNLPFGHLPQMQSNEQFPAGIYNGGGIFFDQAQLGHDAVYGNADDYDDGHFRGLVDGQDEWNADSAYVKKEVTPEAMGEGDADGECEDAGELKLEKI